MAGERSKYLGWLMSQNQIIKLLLIIHQNVLGWPLLRSESVMSHSLTSASLTETPGTSHNIKKAQQKMFLLPHCAPYKTYRTEITAGHGFP